MATILAALSRLDDGRHRAEFYRMWRAGCSAAFTHPKSLEAMGQRESVDTEAARAWLLDGTARGRGVADLVRAGGARFDDFERALLTLGDEAGRFEEALRLLGDFFTKKHALMQHVKKQMTYPLVTGLAACFIAPLPVLFFGNAVAYTATAFGAAALLMAGAGGLVAGVAASFGRKPPLARARMARALATAVEAGLTLPRAIRLSADASANPEIRAHVARFSERDLAAGSLSDRLAHCPHLTPDFLAAIRVADVSGDFAALSRLAELYEDGFR